MLATNVDLKLLEAEINLLLKCMGTELMAIRARLSDFKENLLVLKDFGQLSKILVFQDGLATLLDFFNQDVIEQKDVKLVGRQTFSFVLQRQLEVMILVKGKLTDAEDYDNLVKMRQIEKAILSLITLLA